MFILVEISNPRVMFLCTDCITVFADFKTVCKNSHACLSAHKIRLNSKTSCSENQDCTLYGLSNLRTATCNSEILDALRRPSACIKYPILPRLILDKPNEVKVLSGAVRDACRCCGICGLVFRSRKQTLYHLDRKSGKDSHPDVCLSDGPAVLCGPTSKRRKRLRINDQQHLRKERQDSSCSFIIRN